MIDAYHEQTLAAEARRWLLDQPWPATPAKRAVRAALERDQPDAAPVIRATVDWHARRRDEQLAIEAPC